MQRDKFRVLKGVIGAGRLAGFSFAGEQGSVPVPEYPAVICRIRHADTQTLRPRLARVTGALRER